MIKKIVLLFLLPIFVYAINEADVDKGQTYYKFILYEKLNISGEEFTKLYTQKQWRELFSNNSKKFKEKFSNNRQMKEFMKTAKFEEIVPYLKAFTIYYAKDSNVVAQCEE